MSSEINAQFFALAKQIPYVSGLRKFWKVQDNFSQKSPHMLFIIKYYVIKKIYVHNKQNPSRACGEFMRSLAKDLSQLKAQIPGANHDAKIEKIKTSVLSFFGNCQNTYEKNLISPILAQK